MKEKAKHFAKSLGHKDFRASNAWLKIKKKRHNIGFKKVCGESASVNENVCSEWINKLANFLKNYESRNIFNADETALFYKCLVDRNLFSKTKNVMEVNTVKNELQFY